VAERRGNGWQAVKEGVLCRVFFFFFTVVFSRYQSSGYEAGSILKGCLAHYAYMSESDRERLRTVRVFPKYYSRLTGSQVPGFLAEV
jgi:hypothetical protein